MLESISINQFRCFSRLDVNSFSRINLIVGANNSGKTCLLDAIELLLSGSPAAIQDISNRRGELVYREMIPNSFQYQGLPDIRLLFNGRDAKAGSIFSFIGKTSKETIALAAKVVSPNDMGQQFNAPGIQDQDNSALAVSLPATQETNAIQFLPNTIPFSIDQPTRYLKFAFRTDHPATFGSTMAITKEGGLILGGLPSISRPPVKFVPAGSVNLQYTAQQWSSIAASQDEDKIIEILHMIEPDLERIASVATPVPTLFVRLDGLSERVPIGNLGEGVQHLLLLATQLVSAANGTLIVDEIDTGLHVTTMTKMWSFLLKMASAYNVQIFATTHSDDCLRGFTEAIQNEKRDALDMVSLHRISEDHTKSVYYSGEEIIFSTNNNIEVR